MSNKACLKINIPVMYEIFSIYIILTYAFKAFQGRRMGTEKYFSELPMEPRTLDPIESFTA